MLLFLSVKSLMKPQWEELIPNPGSDWMKWNKSTTAHKEYYLQGEYGFEILELSKLIGHHKRVHKTCAFVVTSGLPRRRWKMAHRQSHLHPPSHNFLLHFVPL
jgi:hypothetical protein